MCQLIIDAAERERSSREKQKDTLETEMRRNRGEEFAGCTSLTKTALSKINVSEVSLCIYT